MPSARLAQLVLASFVPLAIATSALAQPSGASGNTPTPPPGDGGALPAPENAPKAEPPVLATFENAPYPAEALAAKMTGDVVLALDIDAEGRVTAAAVQEAAGHGFDEAAQKAALRFVFRPATKGGKPIPSRILYKYSFTLTEAPAASDKPEPPRVGRLGGTVRIGETDEVLADATVELYLPDGHVIKTQTSEKGEWSVPDVDPGTVVVHVEAPGFAPLDGSETVAAGEDLQLIYRLHMPSHGIEVTIRGERQDREITKRTLDRQELTLIPGTGGDALKAIQTLPSVARAPSLTGLVIVRGSAPNGTSMFVDGTFVPNIYHFGGVTSVIPTEMIETIDFFPGNFSAKYGRATGGIIDVRLREMESDGKYHGLAQVDFIDARVLLRGPVPLVKGWNFEIAGRRSHIDTWLTPLLEGGVGIKTAPVYYDWQAFAETKPTPRSVLRLGVFGSDDRLAFVMKNSDGEDAGMGNSLATGTSMMRVQALYRNAVTDKLSLFGSASVGFDTEGFSLGPMFEDVHYIPVSVRGDVSYKISNRLTVRAGPDIIYWAVEGKVRATQPPNPEEPPPGPYSAQPLLEFQGNVNLSGPAAFAEVEWQPIDRAKILLGTRLDYFNRTDRFDVSPRLNVRYDLNQGFPRSTIKAGAGVFAQQPDPIEVIPVWGSKNLRSNEATHYSVGFEQEISREVDFSVEGFYKRLSDLVLRGPSQDGSLGYANVGEGEVIGAETLLKWKPGGRFFGWLAYTLSRSTRRNTLTQTDYLFEYDQTHNLTVLGSYDLGRGWRLGAKFRFTSGNPYTPCVGGVLEAGVGVYACKAGTLYSDRLPSFHQLDVRVDKMWKFEGWQLTTYLDVQNAYNRANPEAVLYNYNYTRPRYESVLPIIPSLGVRGEF